MNLVRTWPQGQAGPTPLGWTWPQPLMPPRVEGWPRGRTPSSDAEALLATAVAYWDASKYRAGDRFLRNQGVAGELLDLRLGSSTVANSNDPTWLKPEDSGYVWKSSGTGNALFLSAFNALSNAASLDIRFAYKPSGQSANSILIANGNSGSVRFAIQTRNGRDMRLNLYDGAVNRAVDSPTGTFIYDSTEWNVARVTWRASDQRVQWFIKSTYGNSPGAAATAAISTTGWTQVGADQVMPGTITGLITNTQDLAVGAYSNLSGGYEMGLSGVVIGDGTTDHLVIDCDAITTGSATSFTARTGQTVTINRSTSGRKTVAMPNRWSGGRACFLFGTDDYMEVQDAWQHQLLNFGQADSFTVLAVVRQWATISSARIISKRNNPVYGGKAWEMFNNNTTVDGLIGDGTNLAFGFTGTTQTAGQLTVMGLNADRAAGLGRTSVGATFSPTLNIRNVSNTSNPVPVSIGRNGAAGNYADMEFTAAAIFRRALSAAEITAITRYYGAS